MKKRQYPKTVMKKKIMKGSFWTGFAFVLFLSVVAIVRVGNADIGAAEQKPDQQVIKEENHATSVGAQSFAENFAKQYFDWQNTDEGKKKRIQRLKPYLATGLDEQAGLAFEGMEWDSSLSDSQVWNVEETGKNTALITLRVEHVLKKVTKIDSKIIEQAKKDKKPVPTAKVEKSGPLEKYFVVPVKTDGISFVVQQIPYLIAPPKKPQITVDATRNENGKIQDSKLQEEISSSLNTFFKIYTTGTQDELSYYIKGNDIQSMKGIITFKEVKDTVITQGRSKGEYQVDAKVMFQENQSKGQLIYPYTLSLVKEEDRWFVKEMKNQ